MKTREPGARFSWTRGSQLLCAVTICAGLGCSFRPANQQLGPGTGGVGGISSGGGGGSGGAPVTGPTALAITPLSATLTVTNGGPAQTQQYMVTGTVNGVSMDLTNQVTYLVNPPGIVTIDTHGLATTTGTTGGIVTVTAGDGGLYVTATLTVNYTFTGADPGMATAVPSNAATMFTSTTNDTTRAPQLIYPNNGVLFPPNISKVEIHFMPGANNTLFEVSLTGPLASVNSFIRCGTPPAGITGCIYLPDPGLWASVATSNAGQGQVQLVVRGTDDSGTSVGASDTFTMQFAKDAVRGALYYWTTSGKTAIMRYDFGGSNTAPAPYLTPSNASTSISCIGCHALSPDGTKLVASANGQGDGRLLLWDVANNVALQPFPLAQRSQFESWNKDGSQFVGVFGDNTTGNSAKVGPVNLMIFDGASGAVTQTIDLMGLRADHPDWSKSMSGTETIAFTSVDATAATTDQRPSTGGIDFIQLNAGTWGAPQVLIPPVLGQNNYYPAITPDGTMLVYDQSTCTSGTPAAGKAADISCDADTDATATMFLAPIAAGAASVALANANSPGVADTGTALANSFPKWAPFAEQLDELNKVLWLTFSSTRQYGLRSPPAPADTGETKKGTLIWMVGISLGVGNSDPSYTAFCLPFQDITTSNHIAQWAQDFVKGPS